MNRIRLLSEQVANQIAAGEVVERPASVVKELVENSLDAQATRITVEIQNGGRSLIRITDDGIGMSRDDALLCLERHATSKIRKAEDLSSISTMGFRGEALPSIASVSRFSLTSRERDSESPEGTQVIVNGGKVVEVKSAGGPAGTVLEVRQLFFNVPARKKFLRTEETEFTHILHYLTLAALSHPTVGFTLVKDGKQVLQLPGGKPAGEGQLPFAAVRERLRAVLGGETQLLPVDFTAELADVRRPISSEDDDAFHDVSTQEFRLWGFIGQPGVSRGTRDQHFVFVNKRPVDNRGIQFALLEGYHTALMKGRYPVCCLFLGIDPARVDVNIHPTKREVKFHNEAEIRRLTAEAVRQSLLAFHRGTAAAVPEAETRSASVASAGSPAPRGGEVGRSAAAAPSETPELLKVPRTHPSAVSPGPSRVLPLAAAVPASASDLTSPGAATVQPPQDTGSTPREPLAVTAPAARPASEPPMPSSPSRGDALPAAPLLQVPLRILGAIGRLYVLMESDRGLVVMDQHAAHERILFEQMMRRLEQSQAASQRLLLPETVELSAADARFLGDLLPILTRLGVGLSEFGERTFLLDGVPPFVKASDARRFVLGLIDELKKAGQEMHRLRLGEEVIAKTVCRHAVKANDPLGGAELEGLLADLRQCEMPYTCPHGRPTLIEMSYRELEKKFGRLQ
ncbi:MAG: DNA mismatch repair endonuclease MutL [Verrucomicrobiales bacterium]|nr:DNA mismatch repair endonuclease MutL [Verrucomicrobiales bacterium]